MPKNCGRSIRSLPERIPQSSAAFTLVEALLGITVFSLGILVIFPSFFRSMELLALLSSRYPAELMIHNAMVETEERLRAYGKTESTGDYQTEVWNGRSYRYRIESQSKDKSARLYGITVFAEWKDMRNQRLARTTDIMR